VQAIDQVGDPGQHRRAGRDARRGAAVDPRLLPADDSGTPLDNRTNVPQPRLFGTVVVAPGETPPTVRLIDQNGTSLGEAQADAAGNYLVPLAAPAAPGTVATLTIRAVAIDVIGNVTGPSGLLTLTIDRLAPPAPTLALAPASDTAPPGDNATRVLNPGFTLGNIEGGTVVTLRRDGVVVAQATPSGPAGQTITLTDPGPVPAGGHLYEAVQVDAAGNVRRGRSLIINRQGPPAPTLALEPASDTGAQGDNVTRVTNPSFILGNIQGGTSSSCGAPASSGRPGPSRRARPGRRSP
jgi:hypothetical protein